MPSTKTKTKTKLVPDVEPENDPLIGTTEVCRILDIHPTTISRYLCAKGKFRRKNFPQPIRGHVGNRLAWRKSQIDAYIASHLQAAS